MASKNLAAELLDKIQIYDDREDDPDHLIEDAKVNKIINLKFKKKFKKSIFGKVYAGGGSRDRFESGGLFNMFKDTLQISIIGVANNLNKTGFSSNDLSKMGGFNRSGNDALYDGSISLGGRSYGGIEKVISGGFNLNNDYGKRLKMNLIYFSSESKNIYESSSFGQQFLSTDTLSSLNSNSYNRAENKHNASGLIQWNPDTLTSIRYAPKLSFTDNSSSGNNNSNRYNDVSALNKSVSNTFDNGNRTQFQHSFSYHRRLKKKGESFNIAHNLNINPDNNNYYNHFDLTSFTTTLNSEELRRLTSNDNRSTSASLDISYRYPFTKKLSGNIELTGRYNVNGRESLTFDQNLQTNQYDIFLDHMSTELDRNQWTERVKLGTTYKFNKKISLDAGLAGEWLQVKNQFNKRVADLHQNYFNLFPSMRLQIADLSLSYNAGFSLPSIYNLQPITVQSSRLYSFTGNPYLQPSKTHNVSFAFNKYYPKKQLSLYSHAGGTVEENSVTTQRTSNNEGVSSSSPINRNGKYNFNIGGGFYKRFKKSKNWQFTMNPYVYVYQNRDFFILNQDEGFQNRWNISVSQRISMNWKDKIELSPEFRISPQLTSYSGVAYQNIKYTSHSLDTKYTIRWPKKIYWEGNYSYSYNPLVRAGFQRSIHLLNSAVALQLFKKDKGEIKLSCYDILNQNITSYRSVGVNSITDSQNQILKQYFLLTYLMKFNKTTTK